MNHLAHARLLFEQHTNARPRSSRSELEEAKVAALIGLLEEAKRANDREENVNGYRADLP